MLISAVIIATSTTDKTVSISNIIANICRRKGSWHRHCDILIILRITLAVVVAVTVGAVVTRHDSVQARVRRQE